MRNTVKFDDRLVLTMREADVLLDASQRFELGTCCRLSAGIAQGKRGKQRNEGEGKRRG